MGATFPDLVVYGSARLVAVTPPQGALIQSLNLFIFLEKQLFSGQHA